MLIEQTVEEFYVHTKEYRLTVAYVEKLKKGWVNGVKLKLMLDSKANNIYPQKLTAQLQMQEEQVKSFYRKLASPILYIHRQYPRLTLLQEASIILKDTTSTFTNKEIQTVDVSINYQEKFWRVVGEVEVSGGTCVPYTYILQRNHSEAVLIKSINTYQLEFKGKSILQLKNQAKQLKSWDVSQLEANKKKVRKMAIQIWNQLNKIIEEKKLITGENLDIIETNSQLIPLIPLSTNLLIKREQHNLTKKEQLFRHIFITELVTHMIINQFGRNKRKHHKYKDGRINYWYEDEQLQALRSCGQRFSEFRDHSAESFNPPEQECESSEESEVFIESDDEDIQKKQKKKKKKKKKTQVQRVGNKIKRVLKSKHSQKKEKVENFVVMSGEDKTYINNKRYCLHQMTRETDKTQALINFIQLSFSAEQYKQDLLWNKRDSEAKKKTRMIYFLHQCKVKRYPTCCLEEYTRESFFHKVLNIGLRILKEPHELTYLRFGFSHVFWSIKLLYQRQKKSIFESKKEKNEKRVIKIYRGTQMSEEEIKVCEGKIGAFIEMEGFLSSTLREQMAILFTVNVFMIIKVPVTNLKGIHDNGFANISNFSDHPSEREVLFNAFNVFKIQSFQLKRIKNKEIYEMIVEYGGIKPVEEKVGKSQNLLESQFLMKIEEQNIQSVRYLLDMKEEKMTGTMVEQLREALEEVEKKLEKWKDTLKKQENSEFQSAYDELSKWEQELLDNYTYQQQTIGHIENYGELLVGLGKYERGIAYCERMLKQVERDKAIEGWEWRKTPCLHFREQKHRFLLAQCYHTQCRYKEEVRELQAIKQLYTRINIPHHHPSVSKLNTHLYHAYDHLQYIGYQKEYMQMMIQCENIRANNSHYHISNTFDVQRQIQEDGEELSQRIEKQRKKLKQISMHTKGKLITDYLSQHYKLILLLQREQQQKHPQEKENRDYTQMKVEIMRYFSTQHLSHTQPTISLFQLILLQIVDDSKIGKIWLCIMCRQLISSLTSPIYHQESIYLIFQCVKLCLQYHQWMIGKKLLQKVEKVQISCPISKQTYDYMMRIYVYMWSTNKECMIWVKNTEQKVYQLYKQYMRKKGKVLKQFVNFPHSIAHWNRKCQFDCLLDGAQWVRYHDIIRACLHMENYYHHPHDAYTARQIEHLGEEIPQMHPFPFVTTQREVRKQLQVRVWQEDCGIWKEMDAEYGVNKYMGKGNIIMVMLYLHHPHPYYGRVARSMSRLHLFRESYPTLDTLIQYAKRRGEEVQRLRSMYDNFLREQSKQQDQTRKVPRVNRFSEGKKQGRATKQEKAAIVQSFKLNHQQSSVYYSGLWKQLESQPFQSQEGIREGCFDSLQQTKEYCNGLISDLIGVDRVIGLWDGHQQMVGQRQLQTIRRLHGKRMMRSPQQDVQIVGGCLTQLVEQEIVKQVTQRVYLEKEEYLIPTFKALLCQNQLPVEFISALFSSSEKCQQLVSFLLDSQEWRKQLNDTFQHHYPSTYLLQKLQQIQQLQEIIEQPQKLQLQAHQLEEEQQPQQFIQIQHLKKQLAKSLRYYDYDINGYDDILGKYPMVGDDIMREYGLIDDDDENDMIGDAFGDFYIFGGDDDDIDDNDKKQNPNKQCMRYGVLTILVNRQELHSCLMKLISPIIQYGSVSRSDFISSQEYQRVRSGYQAWIQACVESKSCLHHGWATPRWWPLQPN